MAQAISTADFSEGTPSALCLTREQSSDVLLYDLGSPLLLFYLGMSISHRGLEVGVSKQGLGRDDGYLLAYEGGYCMPELMKAEVLNASPFSNLSHYMIDSISVPNP